MAAKKPEPAKEPNYAPQDGDIKLTGPEVSSILSEFNTAHAHDDESDSCALCRFDYMIQHNDELKEEMVQLIMATVESMNPVEMALGWATRQGLTNEAAMSLLLLFMMGIKIGRKQVTGGMVDVAASGSGAEQTP